ncbi:hypothetical protein L226DRAFT_565742 [Lentinus tigrinus ALCF2SS1-7]|uniref:Uncharacterized protein n=1 Tax=Lentinus tigrinus ALCF2SS1-6 TaxID=1328759 RepID=A0A5C2SU26_9APHY|nr:hypothetical protein L227DRAFT_648123 [Lentinus tigrinus ALCF2SS1-6]RPD80918.1 hypothetical protein L226DRAFT_565742 [Lentinus tigrinus ALCF2SS1-7]
MLYAKDGSFLLDAEAPSRPDQYTAGPILVQAFLQYLCQGVIIAQASKFYERWDDDPIALRAYVVVLVIFSLVQTVLESYKTWVVTVLELHWWTSNLHFTEFLCNSIICSLCEVFLIRRCYRMSGMRMMVLVYLASVAVITFAASIILTVKIAIVVAPLAQVGDAHVDPLRASICGYPLWVYGTLLTALSITIIRLTYLDRTVKHIITMTWETAALPATCMLVSAIIYSVRDADGMVNSPSPFAEANLDLFFAVLTGKVYTLGLLRTLNKRTQFRARLHSGDKLGRQSLSECDWVAPAAGGGSRPQAETGADGGRTVVKNAQHVTFDDLKDEGIVRSVGESRVVSPARPETPERSAETASGTTCAESGLEDGFSRGETEPTSPVGTWAIASEPAGII